MVYLYIIPREINNSTYAHVYVYSIAYQHQTTITKEKIKYRKEMRGINLRNHHQQKNIKIREDSKLSVTK